MDSLLFALASPSVLRLGTQLICRCGILLTNVSADASISGDSAYIIDPETGEQKKAYVFVGVLNYSMYAYAEAFPDEKQKSWNDAHIHMFEFFGGV